MVPTHIMIRLLAACFIIIFTNPSGNVFAQPQDEAKPPQAHPQVEQTLAQQLAATDQSLRAVGVRDDVSLQYYPEFLKLHFMFKTPPGVGHNQTHDMDFLKEILPPEAYSILVQSSTNVISSISVLGTITSPSALDRISLGISDSAFSSYLMQTRGLAPEEARKIAQGSTRSFKSIFTYLEQEEFRSDFSQAKDFSNILGETAKEFIFEKLPQYQNEQLEELGKSLDGLWQYIKKWRQIKLQEFDLAKHVGAAGGCKLSLKKKR